MVDEEGAWLCQTCPLANFLTPAEKLSPEEQADLVTMVRRRLAERARRRVVQDVESGRAAFAAGGCPPVSVDDLLRELEA
jgi:hypothetical protein